jgi:serine/threonine protein kinase
MHHDTTYKLTHMVGSLRYMAPEVALAQPYNAAADVYSFSLTLWEILVLDRVYKKFCSEDQMRTNVFRKGIRPRLPSGGSVPKTCNAIMEGGWSPRLQDRPSMHTITGMLRRELLTLRHGDDTGLEHKRRSTFIFDEHKTSTSLR